MNVLKLLANNFISEIIVNDKCVKVNTTRYYLDDGALYSFDRYCKEPDQVERFDNGNTEKTIEKFVDFLSKLEDVESVEIVDKPKPVQITYWH